MQFDIFPSLLLVLGLKEAIRDFNDLLQIKRSEKPFLSIDTTLETGNFYITPIVYKNFLFKSEPTIPLAFLIHEKKDEKISGTVPFSFEPRMSKFETKRNYFCCR